MRHIMAFVFCAVLACGGSGTGSTTNRTASDLTVMLAGGQSAECIESARSSHKSKLERTLRTAEKNLQQQGIMTPITPTEGVLGQTQRLVVYKAPEMAQSPEPQSDILARLEVQVRVEIPEEFGVTERNIRGYADRVYAKLNIADSSLKGYTLTIAASDSMGAAFTSFEKDDRAVTILIDPYMIAENIDHELGHVLAGPVFTAGDGVVHVAKEMVAIAAEPVDPGVALRELWSYDLMNVSILGMARNINGDEGVIHAIGAPLDGLRYDLIRLTDEKIGEDGQVRLARAIYEAGKDGVLTMDTVRELYAQAGLQGLVVLTDTFAPGLYLDFTSMKDGTPVVLTKTIDSDGFEGMPNVPASFIYRNQKNEAIGTAGPGPMQPLMPLGDAMNLVRRASALEIRVSGQPYVFVWDSRWSPGKNASHSMNAPSTTNY